MAPQPIIPEGVNAIGIATFIAFLGCWMAAGMAAIALFVQVRASDPAHAPRYWTDPELRKRFLPFIGFCAFGLLSSIIGLVFGGWPTD